MAIISIFTGSYSAADEVIDKLTAASNFRIIDRELFAAAANRFTVSPEKLQNSLEGALSPFSKFTHEREKNIARLRLVTAELIHRDNVIITGYCAHLIPRIITHMLKVCIIANKTYRISQAAKQENITEKSAASLIRKDDLKKAQWTKLLFDKPPYDSSLYDLTMPMHKTTADEAVQMILTQLDREALKTTNISRQSTDDFILAAKIQLTLAEAGFDVDAYAEQSYVTILLKKYVVNLARHQEEIKHIVQKIDGIAQVFVKTGPKYSPPPIIPIGELEAPSKILLVDDEQDFVHTLSERLSARNLESSVVYDGEQALEFVKKDEPEVMVLDLKMPGIDGIEVLRRVKREHPRIEVIILTGHGSEKEETLAEELGAFAYLHKPVNIDLLAQVMREAYKKINEYREKNNSL